jgi:hypothetical protein
MTLLVHVVVGSFGLTDKCAKINSIANFACVSVNIDGGDGGAAKEVNHNFSYIFFATAIHLYTRNIISFQFAIKCSHEHNS